MVSALPPLPDEDLDHVLVNTRVLWGEARGASIFITGGTGFFGTWLLESFARANDQLGLDMSATVLTRDRAAFARRSPHLAVRADITYHQGELRTFTYPAGRFTHLIHAAADTGVWTKGESTDGLISRIAEGMRRILDFASATGVRRFLHVSSGAVYGPQPEGLMHIPEDHPSLTAPLPSGAAWAEGKRVAEQLCLMHARQHGYSAVIARCFAFVGPHLDANYAITSFINDALHRRVIQVTGDGTPHRSYLYASDLAIWLWTMLFSGVSGRAYNVGSASSLPIADVARTVIEMTGEPLALEICGTSDPTRPVLRYVPAVDRAQTELGLYVRVPLADAIRKTMAWNHSAYHLLSR